MPPSAATDPSPTGPSIVWFRRDLRLEDNPAWSAATASADRVLALFVMDRVCLDTAGPLRLDLMAAHLGALDRSLRRRGGSLLVRSGDPAAVVADVAASVGASRVHLNADVSGYSQRRDRAVADRLTAAGVAVQAHWGSLVHRPGTVVSPTTGRAHRVFTPFSKVWATTPWEPWPEAGTAVVVDPGALPALRAEEVPGPGAGPVMAGGEDAASDRLAAWLAGVDDYANGATSLRTTPVRRTCRRTCAGARCPPARWPRWWAPQRRDGPPSSANWRGGTGTRTWCPNSPAWPGAP